MTAAKRPVVVFVLGMSRSGTSALTRVLSLCGAALPSGMMGADKGNQRGYWEPREALFLNRTILERHGSAWWNPSLLDQAAISADERDKSVAEIRGFLTKLPSGAPLVVIKDLSINALSELWFEAAECAGFDVAAVIAVRHPQEVIGSLQAAVKAAPEHASALWLKGNLLAERNTRGVPRAFVEYSNLMEDWRREVKRISPALLVELRPGDEAAIDEFLTPVLHRQHHDGHEVVERFGTGWMSMVYEVMHAAAQDQPVDTAMLDRVFDAYRASERDFRVAFEGSRGYTEHPLTRILRPSIAKAISSVVAKAHHNQDSWA